MAYWIYALRSSWIFSTRSIHSALKSVVTSPLAKVPFSKRYPVLGSLSKAIYVPDFLPSLFSESIPILAFECPSYLNKHAVMLSNLDSFEGLPILIEKAKGAIGITTYRKAFLNNLLRVEVSGPDRPHLTIINLPRLIYSETKQQSAIDVHLI
ncbi:P-loop containing nucleoside triphosphate hydrolase protein [Penicillium alfredii]|uniref:P-loop containing nucleoside triphosphate hydrolase protein n=1 Tax=Penicillium alfredii TaxID=1506179 RepID=A0A9W9GCD0_9EURO|nr:P-loop containing nucleoside triphosphate hydrolase protein [Penicillium alfredii]KAJ5115415.1 P-loop containing nucleoside triphosphate hydrolase protein [Penicillium alfredii]